MQLRSHRRSRHEEVPPEDENSLNIATIVPTTTTTTNTTIRTISNSTSLLMGVAISNDVTTTVNQNHHRRRRCRNDCRSHNTTNEVVVPNTLQPPPPLHSQPIQILPSISSSSASSSSTMSSSTTGSSNSGSCDSIPSDQTQIQPKRRSQRSGLTSNINNSSTITSATSSSLSSSHTAAVATDAFAEHPEIETTGAEANTTNEVPPVEPLSSFPHHRNVTTSTTAAVSSSSIVAVSSQPSPPTSPPRSAPTLTCNDHDTHPDGTSGSDHGTRSQYSSHTSPLPTLMGRHHQLDATNNNSHIRSPLMEQQHSEQHQDHSRLNFHRHHRRRSCSTLSPPPPPQSRRASLTLASFHGHNNHNSDSNATTNHNNGNSGNTGTRRRNSVAPSSMNSSNNSNDVDGQYPSFEYRSSILQHYRRFPSSQVSNTSATAESQSFDGFPLLPIPSLQPSEVPLPIHANRSAAVATIVTNDTTTPSTVNSATNGTTTIPYPIDVVLPPLPFFTAGTSIGTSSNVASRQTDSTAVDETISTSTTQPSPRRSSARIAAVEAQKKQQQDEVVNETLDRRKAPPSSRNSSKKRPPKPNHDKDIFIVEDDCDDDKKCKAREMCCICMSYPDDDNEPMATLSNCVHEFCTHCIMKWADTENSCPLCKQRFTSIVIHRKSHNCSSNHIPNETSNSKKRAKTTSRNRRDNGTKKSSKPYQKIVIQVPTRNQRSETGMVLETILQSLTTTNGIIAAAANFAADGGNVNINPFMSFNFGLRRNDNHDPYHDFITAARASFESGIRAGSTASATQIRQQQQRGPQNPFAFAGASTLFPSMIRSQIAQDRTTSIPLPQSSNIGTNTNSTTGNATANSSQFHFHPAPQPSPNQSLFANFLPTTMTHPMQVDTTGSTTASSSVPRSEQPQHHSPNRSLHVEENWGPFFLQVLGGGGENGTAQSPADSSNSNSTGNHQNYPVNAPSQPMPRTMVAHHQITLLPMGQRLEHGQDAVNDRYNQYLENIASSRTVNNVGNSSNNNNSSSNDTTSRRENNSNIERQHASYFLEMYPFTSAAHNNSNTNQSSLLSRLESDRRQQRQQVAVGMNDIPPERQAQPLSFESMAARRRFLMDDYFEIQAHLSMMGNDNDVDGRRTQPVMATNGGHTVETAIEITEEEDDDMDDDDDVIVLT